MRPPAAGFSTSRMSCEPTSTDMTEPRRTQRGIAATKHAALCPRTSTGTTVTLERFVLVRRSRPWYLSRREVPMAAYSLDLRKRVVRAWDRGMKADAVAATFDVSVAWVYRLVQHRRDTGSIAPRPQTKFRGRALSRDEEGRLVALITARPDATLAELQQALPTRAALSTLWRTIDRLDLTVKKNSTRRRAATA